jgi:hypothetical protein
MQYECHSIEFISHRYIKRFLNIGIVDPQKLSHPFLKITILNNKESRPDRRGIFEKQNLIPLHVTLNSFQGLRDSELSSE